MPLIGLSTSFIPYIMAIIFTMLVFNGDKQIAENTHSKANIIVSARVISFTSNAEVSQSSYHSDFSSHFYDFFTNNSPSLLKIPIPEKILTEKDTLSFKVFQRTVHRRGPPLA
ncbi:MAG: hypothetical protein GXO47_12900 [Chlorobi bacterium]|nr:hypothetical protein [Chlorobiota bacterium]